MDAELAKLIASGGFGVGLIVVVYLIGTRMIKSNDKNTERWAAVVEVLGGKVDDHRLADVTSHGEMREDIAALHGKIDGLLDGQDRYTPVGVEPPQPPRRSETPARGYPIGAYSHRPGTKGDR